MRKNTNDIQARPRAPKTPTTGGLGQALLTKTPTTGGAGQPIRKVPATGGTGRPTVQGFRAGPAIVPPARTPTAKRAASRMNALSRKK